MCSRYSLTSPHEAVRSYFAYKTPAAFPPRYNIAPTQPVGIVRLSEQGEREFQLVRWGLIPSWVKDPREFTTLINARSETALTKPSFRACMKYRRCLVPADGFYEWTGPKGAKRPHLIRRIDGGLLAVAGLWESWLGADGSEMETMAILTVAGNRTMTGIHDRMPALLAPETFETWLDVRGSPADEVLPLLRPAPDTLLEVLAVNPKLNNPRNDGPELQQPIGQQRLL